MLKTRTVFLDTQAFCQQHLRFDHGAIKRLRELCKSRMLNLVVTEVVDGEVRAKLKERVEEAFRSLQKYQKDFAHLAVSPSEAVKHTLSPLTSEELLAQDIALWDAFLIETNATVISASHVSGSSLLSLYFQGIAPFSSGRKKSEFPDAISLLTLESWNTTTGMPLYVVSGDRGLETWCEGKEQFLHIKGVADFLDLYNQSEEKLTSLAHEMFSSQQEWMLEIVGDAFVASGFIYDGNWEADVENVSVEKIDVLDTNVIEVDEQRAVVTVEVSITFGATIDGPDYDSGIWDSEDKRYMYVPQFRVEKTFTDHFSVSMECFYSIESKSIEQIGDVIIDDGKDIRIHEDDGYPYK
jgi:PIN domain